MTPTRFLGNIRADFKAVRVKALKVIEVARNGKAVEVSLIMVRCASLVGHGVVALFAGAYNLNNRDVGLH